MNLINWNMDQNKMKITKNCTFHNDLGNTSQRNVMLSVSDIGEKIRSLNSK